MAKTAYSQPGDAILTPRGVEFEVFARITQRLKAAQKLGPTGFATLARAIYDNRRLWTVLASDVASSGNSLPRDLRARIFYLHEFTQTHSSRVLKGKGEVDVLIDINMAIMRGLRPSTGGGS